MKKIRKYWIIIFVALGFLLKLLFIVGPFDIYLVGVFYENSKGFLYWIVPFMALLMALYVFKRYRILNNGNLFGKVFLILVFFPVLITVFLFAILNSKDAIVLLLFREKRHSGTMKVVEKSIGFNHGNTYIVKFKVIPDSFLFEREATVLFYGGDRKEVYDKYFIGDVVPITFYSKGTLYYSRDGLFNPTSTAR